MQFSCRLGLIMEGVYTNEENVFMDSKANHMLLLLKELSTFRQEEKQLRSTIADFREQEMLREEWIRQKIDYEDRFQHELQVLDNMINKACFDLLCVYEAQRKSKQEMERYIEHSLLLHLSHNTCPRYDAYRKMIRPVRMHTRCRVMKCYV